MSTLRFSDGVNIKTDGPLRVIHLKDGYYVVGEGTCCPVGSRQEGEEFIAELKLASGRGPSQS